MLEGLVEFFEDFSQNTNGSCVNEYHLQCGDKVIALPEIKKLSSRFDVKFKHLYYSDGNLTPISSKRMSLAVWSDHC